ncbi:MAG: hypothetical protein KJ574_02830, partial [Nanoarchaeota archaeon]|nr:hypothetical protein [Nanoarchaeota archaeon]
LQAIKELIDLTVVGLPYSQSENKDTAILYVSDPDEPNFVRTVVDLRNARHYHAERTNVTVSSSVDDRRGFIKGLKKDAKAHKATVYVVEHLSKRVSGQVKMNYAIRELQQKYDEANPKIVRERREAAAAAARMELVIGTSFIRALIESLRHLPQTNPAQPITKAADGTPIAFAGPDGEVSQEIIDALMKAHDGDDVLPRDVYEKACPLCPGSTVGCDKYQQAKKFYESSSSEEGKGSKPIVH